MHPPQGQENQAQTAFADAFSKSAAPLDRLVPLAAVFAALCTLLIIFM